MKIIIQDAETGKMKLHEVVVGDHLVISGPPDERWWMRLYHWVLRRPAPRLPDTKMEVVKVTHNEFTITPADLNYVEGGKSNEEDDF